MKTRLIDWLGKESAASLARAFLDDLVERAREVNGAALELWVAGGSGAPGFFSRRYPNLPVRRQTGSHLGERLSAAFAAVFEEKVDYAVVVGSDHPTLPTEYVERAFDALVAAHLVIGPSRDGGYYLIGLRRYAWPRARGLFERMPWSTPDLLAATREAAGRLGLCHVELPEWYDVDEPSDFGRLAGDVEPGSHTAQMIERLRSDAALRKGG